MFSTTTRRRWLSVLGCLPVSWFSTLSANGQSAGGGRGGENAPTTGSTKVPVTIEGEFAELWNNWCQLHWRDEHFNGFEINAEAFREWKEVKTAWKQVERHVDRHYNW